MACRYNDVARDINPLHQIDLEIAPLRQQVAVDVYVIRANESRVRIPHPLQS